MHVCDIQTSYRPLVRSASKRRIDKMFQAEHERDRRPADRPMRDGALADINCEPAFDRIKSVFYQSIIGLLSS